MAADIAAEGYVEPRNGWDALAGMHPLDRSDAAQGGQ